MSVVTHFPTNQDLEPARISELRHVAGALVGRAEPIGDAERGEDRRDDDRQHDAERVEEDLSLRHGNRSFRIEDASGAAAESRGAKQSDGQHEVAHLKPPLR